jgi:hypothetical protein
MRSPDFLRPPVPVPSTPAPRETRAPRDARPARPAPWLALLGMLAWPLLVLAWLQQFPGKVAPAHFALAEQPPAQAGPAVASETQRPLPEGSGQGFWSAPLPGKVTVKLVIPAPQEAATDDHPAPGSAERDRPRPGSRRNGGPTILTR